jgi:hypothetical protein
MKPMNKFDPLRPCIVHDLLNDESLEWLPAWAISYRRWARDNGEGIIDFGKLILDGWDELPAVASPAGGALRAA